MGHLELFGQWLELLPLLLLLLPLLPLDIAGTTGSE